MSDERNPVGDEPSQRRFSSVAILFALLVLYPLSVGPVIFVLDRVLKMTPDNPVSQTLMTIYAPLIWLGEHSTIVKSVIIWYLNLFGVR